MLEQLRQLLLEGKDPSFVLGVLNNSSFDELVELNLTKNSCNNIYHVDGKYFVPILIATYTDFYEYCAENMIHPSDRSIFLELMQPSTIKKRLEESVTPGFIYGVFRYKLVNGDFKWVEQCVISGERFGLPEDVARFYIFDIDRQKNTAVKTKSAQPNKSDSSQIDPKTTLLNDRAFFSVAQGIIDNLKEEEWKNWCFVSLDIEHFRLFNDWYGHQVGDLLLSKIGMKLTELEKRNLGIAGYIGQDDFCIIAKAQEKNIQKIYDDVNGIISSYGTVFGFSPIIGVCRVSVSRKVSELFDLASVANMAAKRDQKTHICYYSSKMREQTEKEYKILSDFRAAMNRREITFYVQPQVRISTKQIVGGESLARWIKSDGTIIYPNDFIPILEKYGFIVELDQYIWTEVCSSIKIWMDEGHTPLPVSINVSRVDLFAIDVADFLHELVTRYEVPPQLIKVEITESAYVDEAITAKETINKLREYGFAVLMDDFGSGYSSLNSLSSINVDVIKLDAKFLGFDDKDNIKAIHILESIINMNKTIGLPMIIEGVEEKKHVDFLESMGCRYAQGYYFYRPMPKEEFEKLILDEKNIDTRGFLFKSNEQFQIREFLERSIYSDSMLNNVIGASAIYLWHPENDSVDIVRFNQQFYQSVDENDFSQRLDAIEQYMPKEDIPIMIDAMKRSLDDRLNGAAALLRFYKKDGVLLSFMMHFYHIESSENGHRFFGSAQDVTELVKLQHQMKLFSSVSLQSILILNKRYDQWFFNVPVHGLEKVMKVTADELQNVLNSGEFFTRFAPDTLEIFEKLKRYEVQSVSFEYESQLQKDAIFQIDINRVSDETSDAEYVITIRAKN